MSSVIQSETTDTLDNIDTNEDYPTQDISMESSVGNAKENKVLPLRKRRKSNLSQLSKRKTLGKNNSNENSQCTSGSKNTSVVPSVNENNQSSLNNPGNLHSIASEAISSYPTQSSAAESEIDVDNISMLSDESSFTTTNDYSSSQNEILSDDDCTENASGFSARPAYQSISNRHATLFRNNERQGNGGFINNLQVINNNFHTTSLNNGNSRANPNIPLERNGNYQRRNTKNNNSQLNNCQASTSSSSSEQGSTQHNVSTQNNLQAHKSCKNSNLIPTTYTNNASSSLSMPVSSIFTVANNSPHKYAVKNTNISNNIPVGSKEVATANLETQNSVKLAASGSNTNSSDGNSQVSFSVSRDNDGNLRPDDNTRIAGNSSSVADNTVDTTSQDHVGNIISPDPSGTNISSQTNHPLIARSSSNRMQKIQNVDCIQNSTSSSYTRSPSALRKTNSSSLCNYVQNNQGTSKCKLDKFNANQSGVQQRMSSENEGMLNNIQTQPNTQCVGPVTKVTSSTNSHSTARHQVRSPAMINDTNESFRDDTNAINNERQENQSSNIEEIVQNLPSVIRTIQNVESIVYSSSGTNETNCIPNSNSYGVNSSFESDSTNAATTRVQTTSDIEGDNNEVSQDNLFQCTSHNIPSTLNNLNNNTTSNAPPTTHNICSLTNNLHRNKKSNLNQLGRRNVGKEEKVFSTGKDISTQPNTASTSEGNTSGGYQINNSIERNFNKLNSCSQEINAHKNVKTSKEKNKRQKKPVRGPPLEQFDIERYYNDSNSTRISNTEASSSSSIANNRSNNVELTNTSSSLVTNASTSTSDHDPSSSTNPFPDMNNAQFNNENLSKHYGLPTQTDSNSFMLVFSKKELLKMTRNNFNLTQDHSNVRRSNSLNVKMNELAQPGTSASQLHDGTDPVRKSIIKSNSFSIRNNSSQPGTSQTFAEERQRSRNLKTNVNRIVENGPVSSSNARDNLEEFRLEEASNSVPASSEENNHLDEDSENLENHKDPLDVEEFSALVLNNCMENTENHSSNSQYKPGSSTSGSAGVTNPQMIHNNFEPRCKKNKKCNEERDPLKPINSENKPKPNDQ